MIKYQNSSNVAFPILTIVRSQISNCNTDACAGALEQQQHTADSNIDKRGHTVATLTKGGTGTRAVIAKGAAPPPPSDQLKPYIVCGLVVRCVQTDT